MPAPRISWTPIDGEVVAFVVLMCGSGDHPPFAVEADYARERARNFDTCYCPACGEFVRLASEQTNQLEPIQAPERP